MIYSNRDRESTAFLEELEELDRELPNFRLILTMTDDPEWSGETRRVDATFCSRPRGRGPERLHVHGRRPPAMAEGVQAELAEAGVDEANVTADRFSGY